jgi:hypothetical protein
MSPSARLRRFGFIALVSVSGRGDGVLKLVAIYGHFGEEGNHPLAMGRVDFPRVGKCLPHGIRYVRFAHAADHSLDIYGYFRHVVVPLLSFISTLMLT